jgi:CheY-like chemotaxis protein
MRIRNRLQALAAPSKNASAQGPASKASPSATAGPSPRIIVVDDSVDVLDLIEHLLLQHFGKVRVLKFLDGEQAWQEVVREEPDLLISDLMRPGVDGRELLRRLAQRRVKFPVLIVSGALSGREPEVRQCAGPDLRVSCLSKAFDPKEFLAIVGRGLGLKAAGPMSEPPASAPAPRPLRIIHVDDEVGVLQAVGAILKHRLKHFELLQLQNSVTASQLLARFDPDLLITDDCMPVVKGREIVARLAERNAQVPIVVTAGWPTTESWVKEFAARGLRISLLAIPFDIATFFEHLALHLGPLDPPPD